MQNQLDILYQSVNTLELKVNLDKSNIVFCKGGHLAVREKWFYGNVRMEAVNAYKYLALHFTTKLSFVGACNELLATNGEMAVVKMLKVLYRFDAQSLDIFVKLFDSKVQPVLLCASKI